MGSDRIHYRVIFPVAAAAISMVPASTPVTVQHDNEPVNLAFTLVHSGGSVQSAQAIMYPQDIHSPGMGLEASDAAATTGDPFTFGISVSDNLLVGTLKAELWFGNDSHANATLSGSCLIPFQGSIDVPGARPPGTTGSTRGTPGVTPCVIGYE